MQIFRKTLISNELGISRIGRILQQKECNGCNSIYVVNSKFMTSITCIKQPCCYYYIGVKLHQSRCMQSVIIVIIVELMIPTMFYLFDPLITFVCG